MDSEDRKYTVYMHTSPSGKKYIGITCRAVVRRWGSGGQGYSGCSRFWNAICKYGWDNILHEVLAAGLTEVEAKQREKDLIAAHKTRDQLCGYNLTDGGDGSCGCTQSEKTKALISAANKGKFVSAETKQKMSAAQMGNQKNLGNKASESTRVKMSAWQRGVPKTTTTKQKLRDVEASRVKDVECLTLEGDIVARYVSLGEAAEKTGICKGSICHVCSGHRKTAGNFRWRYA